MNRIALLTLNAHMGFSLTRRRFVLPELRDAIHSSGADVVCLQEVMGENRLHQKRVARWPNHPQYEFLADSLWPQFAYGRNAAYPHGHHGNALLSRFPILRQVNHDVSVAGHEGRGLLHCVLDIPGKADGLHVICVHLGLRESHRRHQIAALGQVITAIPAHTPLVVAGDFNDWRLQGHRHLLGFDLEEAFEQVTGRLARSFPARLPVLQVDRVYVRHVQVESTQVLSARPWSHLSDHAPLLATLTLP